MTKIETLKAAKRFWSKVDASPGEDQCWPWLGGFYFKRKNGQRYERYGRFRYERKSLLAHRAAYSLANGDIPDGLLVRHSCDNPKCCNPAHLLIGTNQDNTDDKVSRNRQPRGETNGMARLSKEDVFLIRENKMSCRQASELFGVTMTQIYYIRQRKSWKHV